MAPPMLILTADHLITMDPAGRVLADAAVAIDGAAIFAVGPAAELVARHPGAAVRDLGAVVLMPGLINAHAHAGLLRGTAEHLPVWQWLTRHVNPMHRVLAPEDALAAAMLCYAESLLAGTTTIVDMWRFMDGSARAAATLGNRLVAVPYVGAHPDYDYFDSLADNAALLARWHRAEGGRINVWVGLEHPFYADAAGIARAVAIARDADTGLHTHCSEAAEEVEEFVKRFGARPMFALDKLGFFKTRQCLIAHAVWLDQAEIGLLAAAGGAVAHNPVSNMKLASGIAPVAALLAAGVAVGLGTDGEKENNNFDLFEEMKTASLLGKLGARDASAMDSWQVLRMATCLGARALGLEHEIGSIEPGKRADLIAVRADTPRMTPLFGAGPYFNLHHNLVHAVRGGDVAMTMVDGQVVVENGRLVNADLPAIIDRARQRAPGLFARRAAWLNANPDGGAQWTQP